MAARIKIGIHEYTVDGGAWATERGNREIAEALGRMFGLEALPPEMHFSPEATIDAYLARRAALVFGAGARVVEVGIAPGATTAGQTGDIKPYNGPGAIDNGGPVDRGGKGSGHHGHKGRPGQVGGSAPGPGGTDAGRPGEVGSALVDPSLAQAIMTGKVNWPLAGDSTGGYSPPFVAKVAPEVDPLYRPLKLNAGTIGLDPDPAYAMDEIEMTGVRPYGDAADLMGEFDRIEDDLVELAKKTRGEIHMADVAMRVYCSERWEKLIASGLVNAAGGGFKKPEGFTPEQKQLLEEIGAKEREVEIAVYKARAALTDAKKEAREKMWGAMERFFVRPGQGDKPAAKVTYARDRETAPTWLSWFPEPGELSADDAPGMAAINQALTVIERLVEPGAWDAMAANNPNAGDVMIFLTEAPKNTDGTGKSYFNVLYPEAGGLPAESQWSRWVNSDEGEESVPDPESPDPFISLCVRVPGNNPGESFRRSDFDIRRITSHEMGHYLEYGLPGLSSAVQELVQRRTGRDLPTTLGKAYAARGEEGWLKDNRLTKPDRWMDPYAGIEYGERTMNLRDGRAVKWRPSEVFSMGLQYLLTNPAHLAKADPELFNFVLAAIQPRAAAAREAARATAGGKR